MKKNDPQDGMTYQELAEIKRAIYSPKYKKERTKKQTVTELRLLKELYSVATPKEEVSD